MKVLGISPLDKDSTITIVEDGRLLYAAGEERFTRVKLQDGFPWQALQDGLQFTGFDAAEFDRVTYPFFTSGRGDPALSSAISTPSASSSTRASGDSSARIREALGRVPQRQAQIPGLGRPQRADGKGLRQDTRLPVLASDTVISRNVAKRGSEQWGREASTFHRKWQDELEEALGELGLLAKLKRVEHHLSHAANAYYTSGFDEALIVTLDGYGSGLAGTISIGRNGRIDRLHGVEYPHSLGTFYESVTSALGFKPSRHEGKIVGLGRIRRPVRAPRRAARPLRSPAGQLPDARSNNLYFARMLATQFPKIDVAAAYQHVLEHVATAYVAPLPAGNGPP